MSTDILNVCTLNTALHIFRSKHLTVKYCYISNLHTSGIIITWRVSVHAQAMSEEPKVEVL